MTFGIAGFSRIDLGGSSVQSIIRLADGTLGVTGLTSTLHNEFLWGLEACQVSHGGSLRIDANSGLPDLDFGSGATLVDFATRSFLPWAWRRLIQQADGKLLAVGDNFEPGDWWNYRQLALARVDLAGAGNAGVASFDEAFIRISERYAHVVLSVRRTGGFTGACP